MEKVKSTDNYTIFKKKNNRYAVKASNGWVNGDEKVKILVSEKLITVALPKVEAAAPAEESAPVEEAPAETPSEEAKEE